MFQSLFVSHIGIVFICIVTTTRGKQSRVFSTNKAYEWFDAKSKCILLKNERNFSTITTRRGWTQFSAEYLPGVEYLGCFKFRNVNIVYGLEKHVTEGEQLQECIVHCYGSQLFGLQESNCICLRNYNRTDLHDYIEKPCDTNVAICSGDPFGFCGKKGGREFLSVYQKAPVNLTSPYGSIIGNKGNCLERDNRRSKIKYNDCSTKLFPLCFNADQNIIYIGNQTKKNWKDALISCHPYNLANYTTLKGRSIQWSERFWLSNTRRWKQLTENIKRPFYCVAAEINKHHVVKKVLHKCTKKLPGLCTGNLKAASKASSTTSSTLSQNTKHIIRRINTSPSLQSSSLLQLTTPAPSHLPKSTIVSKDKTTTYLALTETTLLVKQESIFPRYQKTTSPGFQETNSSEFQETIPPGLQDTTSPALLESFSSSLPVSDGIDAILILAIIAAVSLTIIIIIVTVVFCKRKRTTPFTVSDQPMANVGKEVLYAQVSKPTVKREKSTSSKESQLAATDDTYDHMDHRRLSQTHNPIESNYDTMRSIANAGEEENNYDHVTGTKMEPQRFVVDGASNYSHVEVECHEVKDI